MKKKVFSLMMMCVLAFMGIANAQQALTVYDGDATNSYVPVYGYYTDAYLKCEYVMPAADLAQMTGGDINGVTYYLSSPATASWGAANFQVFMKEVDFTSIDAYQGMDGATLVYEGALDGTQSEMEITFTTPYHYNGGNLLVGVYNTVQGTYKSCAFYGESVTGAAVQGYSYSSLDAATCTQRNFLPKATFAYVGGGDTPTPPTPPVEQGLHIAYMDGETQVVDELNLGVRPANAWMEPFNFTMFNTGVAVTVNNLDVTPVDGLFTFGGEELPFTIGHNGEVALNVSTNATEAGLIEREFVAITEGDRTAHIWPITAEIYTPEIPDVVELAMPVPSSAFDYTWTHTPVGMHNDYHIPPVDIPDGNDAVYKLTILGDMVLNASVIDGDNGKVALYTQDFSGQPGPMVDNYYLGHTPAGGSANGTPFEVQIGDGTGTTGYFPFYTLYNYSISENLFLAQELEDAGVTTAPMGSLSWYATNAPGYAQQGISIWMANVEDVALTTTSHVVNNMTLVYTGAMTPAIGWNEFVFNEGTFAWDGVSNVLIFVQRNNGEWNSTVYWQSHNPGFAAMAYRYQDSNAYDVTIPNTMYTSSTARPNVIMKSVGRNRALNDFADGFEAGIGNWTTIDADGDGEDWYDIVGNANIPGHNTSNGLATSASYANYVALYPDNYLVSPQLNLGGTFTFWACGQDASYAAEHFGVAVSTTNNTNASAFTTIQQWTMTAKGSGAQTSVTRSGNRVQGTWYQYNVDLSAYAGQTGYVAIRHFNCYDEFRLNVDDVVYTAPTTPPGPGPDPDPTPTPVGSAEIVNMPLTQGVYYLVASSTSDPFTVQINTQPMPCPEQASNPSPADNEDEVEPASVQLMWNLDNYTTEYRLVFGSTYYCEDVLVDWTSDLAQSYTVRNLFNNTNYFWRVDVRNGSNGCEVLGDVWGFTTHLNVPQNLTVADETIFEGENAVLSWTAIQDRTYRKYNIYQDGVLIGSTPLNQVVTTYTVSGLTYNMDGYTFQVSAVYDEGESALSNPVNVKVSGTGIVSGHVYEQDGQVGIAGSTVTFTGVDEFNVNHTYTFTTNAQGAYSGTMYAGSYNGMAAHDGYQTIYEPVQGNPVGIVYNNTTSPIDFILDENFDGPCTVIAQYYPDSLDPESPYVKVYWGCGLPGEEIIEDFETGDFSMFDWQVDATYPWTVTTTNPYEGTYCMKSGGAGVANVVSNMSVTVNIPADGLMSFFGKISCENNWDYGYFYIDGVQKASFTGAGNWVEKSYDVTAGDHTFLWQYTKDGSVNSNDDCFYVDYINFYKQPEPTPPGTVYDFENSSMQGWTTIDADGDGYTWMLATEVMGTGYGYNGSNDCVLSQSYNNSVGVLYPDNYLVSPQVTLGGVMTFYACAQDASYAAEHFGVAVSTTSNSNPSAFTMLNEWTMSAKAVSNSEIDKIKAQAAETRGHSRGGNNRAQGNWYQYTVDLSAYSGTGYVAIRHFNCSDMFYLDVDNILIGEPSKAPSNRAFSHYRVYRTNCYNDGPYTLLDEQHPDGNTVVLACELQDTLYIDVDWPDVAPGVYKWGVGVVYAGNRGQEIAGPITWSEPVNINNTRDELTYDFENGFGEWTSIDADGDGYGWELGTDVLSGGYGHNGSNDLVLSRSYVNYVGALTPDNYLVSPQVTLGGSISFWACAQDASYAAEHFGVAVSTTSNTSASAFTTIQEWTMTAKGTRYNGPRGNRDQGNWYQYTVDLSAYSGMGYVAIRHFNCTDEFYLDVDDITISTSAGPTPPTPPTPGDNTNTVQEPRESEIVWSNCLEKGMYLGEGEVDITVLLNSADSPEGVTVNFTNLNEYEQELYPIAPLTLDETGYYSFDSFRKGDYAIAVNLEGYEPIFDTVAIWNATSLRYVMIEIIYGVNDLYVSSTGWAMWEGMGPVGPDTPVNPPTGDNSFEFGFENGFEGWTTIDNDGDGLNWVNSVNSTSASGYDYTGLAHGGNYFVYSQSFIDYDGAYNADNYLVSPQKYSIVNGSTLSFWADNANDSYPDHFAIAIATVDNPTASDFTDVWSHQGAKSGNKTATRYAENRYQNWRSHSVDLSAYAGQNVWIAFHHQDYDEYEIWIDDVVLTPGRDGDRHLEYYKVMCTSIDGEPIFNANTVYPFCQVATDELVPGEHYICKVAAAYSTGMSAWTETEWQYIPCENYAGTVNGPTLEGNTITWDYPGGGTGPTPPGPGDGFTVDFESGLPTGWTVIDGNNDGWTWCLTSAIPSTWTYYASLTLDWYHGGSNAICSGSYINGVGALTPDEYLVSPQVTLAAGSQLSFWVAATDASYPADHFGVFISDNGTSGWTSVQEWTLTAKKTGLMGGSASRNGEGLRLATWYNYSVDLSSYAGQKYIAFRHFNCTDQYIMCLDDITLTSGSKGNRAEWSYANGFVTDPGAMANGADASWTKGSQTTWGPNVNNGGGYMLADDFTVDAATNIDEITVYAYQTGSSTTSTFTGLYAQIYNGSPMSGGTAVWGDITTNIMTATAFTNCYRGSDGETSATTRPIMGVTAGGLNINLEPGTYYLVFSLTGSLSSGPWGAPQAEPGVGNTGNGLQYTTSWGNLMDSGAGTSYGCAMTIHGTTGSGPVPPEPNGDVLGAMIFADGEWEAFVPAPTNTYEYTGNASEVCVRMVYNGTNTLPEGNIYYSMSCPECVYPEVIPTCEPGAPIHVEELHATDQIKVWWGEEPQPGISEWIYYDDGVYGTSIGVNGGVIYWASMFPANLIAPYAGTNLTKVALYENSYNTDPVTVSIYLGGSNAPGTQVSTMNYNPVGGDAFHEVTLTTPVAIDGTQNLWIVFSENGTYPANACADTGEANNRWVSLDGADWMDVASAGVPGYGWMIRGFLTNEGKGGIVENIAIEPAPTTPVTGNVTLSHTEVVSMPADLSFMNLPEIVKYNVYRSDDNVTYNMIGEVAAVAGQTYYEYIDTPESAGTYYYQVRADYGDCESDPAPAFDDPTHNYVSGNVDAIDEYNGEVVLYPNPTKGNVTIQAEGMSRITVVSVLGQVVFDTEVSESEYTLNMAQFNAGMYMVRINTENGVVVKRVTVVE